MDQVNCRAVSPATTAGAVLRSMTAGASPHPLPSEDPMTERPQPLGSSSRTAPRRTPRSRAGRSRHGQTVPAAAARDLGAQSEPTLFGLPAEFVTDEDTGERSSATPPPEAAPSDVVGIVVV